MRKTTFICQLSEKLQEQIAAKLRGMELAQGDIADALCGRLCDLEEILDINAMMQSGILT